MITNVAVSDATQYTCIATNVVGRATKLTTLVVHGKLQKIFGPSGIYLPNWGFPLSKYD